jgi:hypothetical protein
MSPENANAPERRGRGGGGDEREEANFQLRLFPSLAPSDKCPCDAELAWSWAEGLTQLCLSDEGDDHDRAALAGAVAHALDIQRRDQRDSLSDYLQALQP